MKKSYLILGVLAAAAASVAFAQDNPTRPHGPGRGPHGRHPAPPLIRALDTNHDGVISADEIANAPRNLLLLDTDGDGKLSAAELCPPPPPDAPPRPANASRPHPRGPLMLALDANGDGELSADEIANAATSLKALDLNHDGQLTPDEFAPMGPEGGMHRAPPPGE